MFLEDAKLKNKKPSALIREIIYKHVEQIYGNDAYEEATKKDEINYQKAVNARLVGRGLPPKPLTKKPETDNFSQ